jgi:hypothetical protein
MAWRRDIFSTGLKGCDREEGKIFEQTNIPLEAYF